ncbi:MAG: hypothetical protein ACRDMV_03700 [Streptosporangiales bacterium]
MADEPDAAGAPTEPETPMPARRWRAARRVQRRVERAHEPKRNVGKLNRNVITGAAVAGGWMVGGPVGGLVGGVGARVATHLVDRSRRRTGARAPLAPRQERFYQKTSEKLTLGGALSGGVAVASGIGVMAGPLAPVAIPAGAVAGRLAVAGAKGLHQWTRDKLATRRETLLQEYKANERSEQLEHQGKELTARLDDLTRKVEPAKERTDAGGHDRSGTRGPEQASRDGTGRHRATKERQGRTSDGRTDHGSPSQREMRIGRLRVRTRTDRTR